RRLRYHLERLEVVIAEVDLHRGASEHLLRYACRDRPADRLELRVLLTAVGHHEPELIGAIVPVQLHRLRLREEAVLYQKVAERPRLLLGHRRRIEEIAAVERQA